MFVFVQGHKIGLMGLVEYEWMATLASIEEHEVDYSDFVVQVWKPFFDWQLYPVLIAGWM